MGFRPRCVRSTLCRLTGSPVFAFEHDFLQNLCLVDKEDASVKGCADQPITQSYCIFVQRSGQPFSIEYALKDGRVNGHPKQPSYQCYYGIPLVARGGKLLGTAARFDIKTVPVSGDVVMAHDD